MCDFSPFRASAQLNGGIAKHWLERPRIRESDGGSEATRYAEANDAFHTAIYEGAHNGYLCDITVSTRQRLQPFRRAQFGAMGRLAQSHAEHGLIVEAILRGDRGEAEAAMRQHIAIVGDAYERLVRR